MDFIADMTQRGKKNHCLSLLFLFLGLFSLLFGLLFRFRGQISGGWGGWKRVMQLRFMKKYFRVIFGGEEAPPFVPSWCDTMMELMLTEKGKRLTQEDVSKASNYQNISM